MWGDKGRTQLINRNTAGSGGREAGFTLIELLVVILILGILAAIAIPTFLSQKSKADDAQAKALVRTAATAIEAYSTSNNGSYVGATPATLQAIEPSINTTNTSSAELTGASGTPVGYTLVATAPNTGDTFTIIKNAGGEFRLCAGAGKGCPAGGTW